jgi:hypothetical protein
MMVAADQVQARSRHWQTGQHGVDRLSPTLLIEWSSMSVDSMAVACWRAGWELDRRRGDDTVATLDARARSFGKEAWAAPVHAAFRFPQQGRV